jgi:hypothetical protein
LPRNSGFPAPPFVEIWLLDTTSFSRLFFWVPGLQLFLLAAFPPPRPLRGNAHYESTTDSTDSFIRQPSVAEGHSKCLVSWKFAKVTLSTMLSCHLLPHVSLPLPTNWAASIQPVFPYFQGTGRALTPENTFRWSWSLSKMLWCFRCETCVVLGSSCGSSWIWAFRKTGFCLASAAARNLAHD